MTRWTKMIVVVLLAAIMGVGTLMPMAARASENGRKNTTLALGGITAFFLGTKQWVPAALAGVGTYAAYHNWQAAINARHRRERALYYRYHSRHHRTRHRSR